MRDPVLCVDVGSTFTKAVLVDAAAGDFLAGAAAPTHLPPDGDALTSVIELRERLAAAARVPVTALRGESLLVCSSAGGGLRIAVVGQEELVSAEAGHRVALTAGGSVVHVHAGPLDRDGIERLRAARSDVVLLAGGTDGGNAQVLVHNARRLGIARVGVPIVVAGNADAAPEAAHELTSRARKVVVAPNVLPRIGQIAPDGARTAIREMFLKHVIGGKGLSRQRIDGQSFGSIVRMPTPDAMLAGVGVLGDVAGDVLVVDIGGATTDVYSALHPSGEDAALRKEVVAPLWLARTVEGDLGMRWSATGVVAAAQSEVLLDHWGDEAAQRLHRYAEAMSADPSSVPADASGRALDTELAALAARVAVRRHGRASGPAAEPRPLSDVRLIVGSGGALRHGDAARAHAVLAPISDDHAGGWRTPRKARTMVDARYLLFAAGLLSSRDSGAVAARRLAATVLAEVEQPVLG